MHKRIKSFGFAINGIKSVIRSEANMKIHIAISIAVVILGILLKISLNEWLVCLLCMAIVFSLEMLNTAIEHIVDLVSPDYHPLAGKAKDAAAGAVLVAATLAAITGTCIFLPKLLHFL